MELILTECGAEAAAETRAWLPERPRVELLVAPPGHLWTQLIGHWFPPGNASDPAAASPARPQSGVHALRLDAARSRDDRDLDPLDRSMNF
jgi:hypothetical protein